MGRGLDQRYLSFKGISASSNPSHPDQRASQVLATLCRLMQRHAKQRIPLLATQRIQAIHLDTSSFDCNTHTPWVQVVAHIGEVCR